MNLRKNLPFVIAGRTWTVPDVCVGEEEDGRQFISSEEMRRVNLSIAAALLSERAPLAGEEFAFFVDIVGVSQKEIASLLRCTTQAFSRWKKLGFPPLQSDVLREYLFSLLFEKSSDGLTPSERVAKGCQRICTMGLVATVKSTACACETPTLRGD